jgi:hypothetical protein
MSASIKEGHRSVLLHRYLRGRRFGAEHYEERIELGLFTRDEMTWAYEFAGMEAQYASEGLMGRGLYIGKHIDDLHLRASCYGAGGLPQYSGAGRSGRADRGGVDG